MPYVAAVQPELVWRGVYAIEAQASQYINSGAKIKRVVSDSLFHFRSAWRRVFCIPPRRSPPLSLSPRSSVSSPALVLRLPPHLYAAERTKLRLVRLCVSPMAWSAATALSASFGKKTSRISSLGKLLSALRLVELNLKHRRKTFAICNFLSALYFCLA